LWRLKKLPFTCSYVPGGVPVVALLAGYWVAFMLYTHAMAYLEHEMLQSRVVTAISLGGLSSAWYGVTAYRRRARRESVGFLFHQEPEPVVCTLNLSH
jgi:hypothetical protein